MSTVSQFMQAQAAYARLEAVSTTRHIELIESQIDEHDMSDESVQAQNDIEYLERERRALVKRFESLTGSKYPERGPQ